MISKMDQSTTKEPMSVYFQHVNPIDGINENVRGASAQKKSD